MRTNKLGFVLWLGAGLLLGINAVPGRAQPGPDAGAVLRDPFADPPPRPMPKSGTPADSGPTAATSSAAYEQILANLTIDPRYAMNRDIQPTPEIGPWMICIHSYITKEAPEWSRQMAGELRGRYKLPAYVFTYGLEERRREYERVKGLVDQQRRFIKEQGLELMYTPGSKGRGPAPELDNELPRDYLANLSNNVTDAPVRTNDLPLSYAASLLKMKHIPVQCAVLVGGYANEDAAHRALIAIHKLPQPEPNKVQLDVKFYGNQDTMNKGTMKFNSGAAEYVNPFTKAFVCRNPSVKQERGADPKQDSMDINVLRKFNADESLSLLNCRKPITLAIKQYQTYTTIQSKEENSSVLDSFGFKTRAGEGVDQAAHDAHNLAEMLRKNKLEAYVLHTKFTSIVTVGGYDSLDDVNLRTMQSTLETRLRTPELARLMFFPRPMPMKVPQ